MSFDPVTLLRRSTARAKSDVANKLVGMLLHELSKQLNQKSGIVVNSTKYGELATDHFGDECPYCGSVLIRGRVAVEHLDGMNRFRAGLHVPGNVVIACADRNREKRRDDQLLELLLADSGWESFLSHDSTRCPDACKTCAYWRTVCSNQEERAKRLADAKSKIRKFRSEPLVSMALDASAHVQTRAKLALETLYRDGQEFAANRIRSLTKEICGA